MALFQSMKPLGLSRVVWALAVLLGLGCAGRLTGQGASRASISGKVLDAFGKPLSGADVRLEQDGWELAHTQTSGAGEFELTAAWKDVPTILTVVKAEFWPVRTNLPPNLGQGQQVNLVLADDTSIQGTTLAFDRTPLANMVVQAVRVSALTRPPPASAQNASAAEGAHGPLESGLMAEYFSFAEDIWNFPKDGLLPESNLRRVDPQVNFPESGEPFGHTPLTLNFYARWIGRLRINQAGRYTFYLNSNDGSRLWIDGPQIVENSGEHAMVEKSGSVELSLGDHDLKLDFFQSIGGAGCVFSWSAGGLPKQVVPPEVLFHEHGTKPATAIEPVTWNGRLQSLVQVTNEKGEYRFRHLPPGQYSVRCHLLGGVEEPPIEIAASPQSVNFVVAPPKKGVWKNYTVLDGMPALNLTSIAIATNGVAWFSTQRGLTRFDGQRFSSYPRDNAGGQNMWSTCLDASGAVWAAFQDGVSRFDGSQWTRYTPTNGLPTNWTQGSSVELDKDGAIWISSYWLDGLGAARFDGHRFLPFTTNQGLPNNTVSVIRRAPDGQLWFGTWGGVARYDGRACTVLTEKDGLVANVVFDIVFSPNGDIWFGTLHGLSRYDGKNFANFTAREGLATPAIERMAQDEDGVLWLAHGWHRDGLTRFDGKSFLKFRPDDGMAGTSVMDVRCQRGAVWLATYGGISRYDEKNLVTFNEKDDLPMKGIGTVACAPDGSVWCADRYDYVADRLGSGGAVEVGAWRVSMAGDSPATLNKTGSPAMT